MDIHSLILWEDDTLLAVNKPAGLRTIADGYEPSLPHLAGLLQQSHGRIWVVHRLDKDTSGVILFARTSQAHRALNIQFEQRETRKEYRVILVGVPDWQELTISLPLRTNGDRQHRTIVDSQSGKPAGTDIHIIQPLGFFTLASAFPHTGYTHQIRAHLAAVGFPILDDPLYQSLKPDTQITIKARQLIPGLPIHRLALHAFSISFMHPVTGAEMIIEAPYPLDFQETITFLNELESET